MSKIGLILNQFILTGEDNIVEADLETIIVDVTLAHHHRLPQRQKGLINIFPHFKTKIKIIFLLSFMNRHGKKRRSLSSSSSSSSSSSKSSSSSSKSPVRRRSRSPPKSVEQKIRRVDPLTQRECDSFKCLAIICFEQKIFEQFLLSLYNVAKELDRTVRTAEKLTAAPNQISTAIVAPVNPAPIEVPPSEPPIIREEPKLPEVQVPIKKYYGRKRDTRSSTSGEDINYEEAESIEKNK